ncbi:hypothetical protein [Sinisalibacter aestuarii]|uniref:Uncharacterized protein n=1 Tax=Sinisalibacter aestuarii TaxID=2949426 RepID=A0ABQ5LUU9_9RHOB|nr:hypothetical protein [Sinisalibacter aestuarii]GKY88757.1 hypothetical protein STA1M1_26260 [Sinisalibacter aestuarii]
MRQAGFAYAHVRLQARLASVPSPADWQMIETSRDFSQCLDAASRTSLAGIVARLGRESSRAATEEALRQAWAETVDRVATWVPPAWQPALRWFALLPHLRVIEAGMPPPLDGSPELAEQMARGATISQAWRAGFATRLPARDPAMDTALAPLFARFLEGQPSPASETAALWQHLDRVFRRQAQEPVAALAWLGLMALVFERLRGALLRALLFPARAPAEAG